MTPQREPQSKKAKKNVVKKRSMRDVIVTPSIKQIEQSFQKGTTHSMNDFRKLAGW
jgi:hypothetical protein